MEIIEIKTRAPSNFEDCVKNLRLNNCEKCTGKIKRGLDWKHCPTRVSLYLREGGYIQM